MGPLRQKPVLRRPQSAGEIPTSGVWAVEVPAYLSETYAVTPSETLFPVWLSGATSYRSALGETAAGGDRGGHPPLCVGALGLPV
jgi:hypothetical protein